MMFLHANAKLGSKVDLSYAQSLLNRTFAENRMTPQGVSSIISSLAKIGTLSYDAVEMKTLKSDIKKFVDVTTTCLNFSPAQIAHIIQSLSKLNFDLDSDLEPSLRKTLYLHMDNCSLGKQGLTMILDGYSKMVYSKDAAEIAKRFCSSFFEAGNDPVSEQVCYMALVGLSRLNYLDNSFVDKWLDMAKSIEFSTLALANLSLVLAKLNRPLESMEMASNFFQRKDHTAHHCTITLLACSINQNYVHVPRLLKKLSDAVKDESPSLEMLLQINAVLLDLLSSESNFSRVLMLCDIHTIRWISKLPFFTWGSDDYKEKVFEHQKFGSSRFHDQVNLALPPDKIGEEIAFGCYFIDSLLAV
jgi:hypothetical protein